jgi:hypothetical protein
LEESKNVPPLVGYSQIGTIDYGDFAFDLLVFPLLRFFFSKLSAKSDLFCGQWDGEIELSEVQQSGKQMELK